MTGSRIITGLVIPTDRPPHIAVLTSDLEVYQHLVGGYIEAVVLDGAVMFVNEDGKNLGLPYNEHATTLARATAPAALHADDYLVGDAVVVGTVDPATGRTTEDEYDVPPAIVELCERLGFPVTQPD